MEGARQTSLQPLISVVVPLFQGAETIERTLRSIQRQTWPRMQIVVVDDGSSDGGPELVRRAAREDRRIRLITQANAGVAEARNRGARAAAGDFLAFVDADDLCAPDRLELQMATLGAAGEEVRVVYTWSALIDENDRVYSTWHRPDQEGWVFGELCRANFVGNGSCTLIRRAAFEKVGGYDPSLLTRGAQGCEDLMIYLRLAEHFEFRVVRRPLTGYRITHVNMSSDALRMLRSCQLTLDAFRSRYPEFAAQFEAHERDMAYGLLTRAIARGPAANAAALLSRGGLRHAFDLAPRAGDLAWVALKARAPLWAKRAGQRVLHRDQPFRPLYSELASASVR